MSVQEYLEKHLLSRKIEEAVNAAVRAKAPDPVLFIAGHMRRAAPAVITRVRARQILDGHGAPAVEAELGVGANAMLAVSIAACKAGAAEKEVPLYKHIANLVGKSATTLPVPAITVINGGKHAGNGLPIQEIMILPIGAKNFEEAMQMGSETYHHLKIARKDVILEKYGSDSCNIGDHGGISEGLDLVIAAIERAGYNGRIKLAIDVAATDFCTGKKYDLEFKSTKKSGQNFKTADDMIEIYSQLCSEYPLVSIEQPFDKDDWEHSKKLTTLELCQVAGDDLLMSDPERIKRAVNEYTCNALVLKARALRGCLDWHLRRRTTPKANQVGTVTEAIEVVKQAKDAHWGVMVSHRSGDTEDSFIADLAVGASAGQIKAGAPCRGECLTNYNQLLRIEGELGSEGVYAGENWRTVNTS
ncbi:Enolase [Zea mays]|uniref:phosphopyruvate hydratase n=1 Tax=Zea mays TaxID=4577 RepID=A0A1D6PE04_MAIZE|nr:Enolase [Zea mays]